MAAFLFTRALNKTEEFYLASNVDGAGAFDDLVFRYRLREPDVWKTCFIQLKHKKCEGTIKRSSLTKMSGNFSLFKYFGSYCQIKSKAFTDHNLKQCGPFDDFEFVIYTNARMEGTSALQGGDCDPVSILSSVKDNWKYTAFDETVDTDILEFFKELSRYAEGILKLECLVKREKLVVRQIEKRIKYFRRTFTIKEIQDSLDGLQSNLSSMDSLVKELKKCDFSLYREFLGKIKIFQCQTNEKCLETLIKEELQVACQASPSCSNSIYRNYVEALREWWEKSGSLQWLSENSHVWQNVKRHLIEKIKQVSESEIEEVIQCDLRFSQQHIERLSDAIQQNTVLNIITNTKFSTLSKMKTYQTLVSLNYKNSVFINSESLMSRHKEVLEIWKRMEWKGIILTNAYIYNDDIAYLLSKQFVSLNVSLDAGTSATYTQIKKVSCFNKVIANLKRYATLKGDITLKYITLDGINTDIINIEGFINVAKEINANVLISRDFSLSLQPCISSTEYSALTMLVNKCRQAGLQYSFVDDSIFLLKQRLVNDGLI